MNEAAMTLEGWYAAHDFRTINWPAWKAQMKKYVLLRWTS